MAGRQDLMDKWEVEQAERAEQERQARAAASVAAAASVESVGDELDVFDSRGDEWEESPELDNTLAETDSESAWAETVAAAIEAQDLRREALGEVVKSADLQAPPGWLNRVLGRVFSGRMAGGLAAVTDAGVTGGLRAMQNRWVLGVLALMAVGLTVWLQVLPRIPINSSVALGEYQETIQSLSTARAATDRESIDWTAIERQVGSLGGLKLDRVRQAASAQSPELLDLQRVGELLPAVLEEARKPSEEPGPAERKAVIHLAAASKEIELQREIANRRQGAARPGAAESTTDRLVFWGLGIVDILLLAWFGRWAFRWWKQRRSIAVRI